MGLLAGLLGRVGEVVLDSMDSGPLAKRREKEKQEFFERNPSHVHLKMHEPESDRNLSRILIYDIYDNLRYRGKGKFFSPKPQAVLYDAKKKRLGSVKQKLVAFRGPFSRESAPLDYNIEINGNKLGTIKSDYNFNKRVFDFDYNNWHAEGDFKSKKYTITNDNIIVMRGCRLPSFGDDHFILDITSPNDELLAVLFAIAIEMSTD